MPLACPEEWIVPDWEAPPWVRAVFTSRAGGVSVPPFDAMNLGDHVGDDLAHVSINRQRLARVLGARPVFMSQVHGAETLELGATVADGRQADAALTFTTGLACTVMVADCLPVLLAHRKIPLVAAAHAGWRGLAGVDGLGVLESVWHRFAERAGQRQGLGDDTVAWLGPCIGPTAFEVGDEVRSAFVATHPAAEACFKPRRVGKWLADLPGLARIRLQSLGIHAIAGNDGGAPWCTVSQASRFFSYRRDSAEGVGTGRMAACVWLV